MSFHLQNIDCLFKSLSKVESKIVLRLQEPYDLPCSLAQEWRTAEDAGILVAIIIMAIIILKYPVLVKFEE